MKKVVGKSLVLGAIALGVLSLLGGPNVFSVLSNIKFPSKPKIEKPVVKKEEKSETDFKEEAKPEGVGDELALETKPQAKPAEEPMVEETVIQHEAVKKTTVERAETKPERKVEVTRELPSKPIKKPQATSPSGYSRLDLGGGIVEITQPSGEKIRYRGNKRIWSSWKGRLEETAEEKAWRIKYAREKNQDSSGSKGKGVWCLTPRAIKNVDNSNECSSMLGWGKY